MTKVSDKGSLKEGGHILVQKIMSLGSVIGGEEHYLEENVHFIVDHKSESMIGRGQGQ